MALAISPGILAVVVILGVELLVIVLVIGFLVWGRNRDKKTDVPDSGKYEGKSHEKGNDDACIVENEVIEEKQEAEPTSSPSTSDNDEKKSLSHSSCTSNYSSASCDEDSFSSESEEEQDRPDNLEKAGNEDTLPYPVHEEPLQAAQDDESSHPCPRLSSSSSSSSSSSCCSSSSKDEEINNEKDVDSSEEQCAEAVFDKNEEEKEKKSSETENVEEALVDPVVSPTSEQLPHLDENQERSGEEANQSQPQLQSFDLGGITLSLRIEPNSSAPSVHVNGQTVDKPDIPSSSSESDDDGPPYPSNQHEDGIEVIRRYEAPGAEKPLLYDPVQKKMYEGTNTSQIYPSLPQDDDYDVTCEVEGEEEAVAGIINVTSGEKLTICQAMNKGLIPKKTALLLLEAQAATGCVVNPRNGVKLSVGDAVTLGIIDEMHKQTLVAAEGAFYGYMDPRTGENVSLSAAMSRGIFPKAQGTRLLEAQIATGGIIDPWTGLRYPLAGALSKGLIDRETAALLTSPEEQTEFFDPTTQKRLGYADLLSKCIRDLDTGLKFLYIEEKPKTAENRYQPELLTFRSAFRKKVTLQELIDAGLVENPILDAFQSGRLSKEELRDLLHPYLVGENPISGILNRTSHKVLTICQAVQEGLLRRGTALELLEAQAATGSMIDPISGKKMSVSRAVSMGLVDKRYAGKLRRAEQAVLGYSEPGTKKTISLFEAMRRGVVVESHGIRMLEAQVATGGIIDPAAGYRIPTSLALQRGLFDQRTAQILTSNHHDMKGYYDPNTGDNLTYGELMQRCVRNKKKYGNMRLLPIRDKAPMADAMQKAPYRNRKVIIMNPTTRKQLTVEQAVAEGVIDRDTAQKLTKHEASWPVK